MYSSDVIALVKNLLSAYENAAEFMGEGCIGTDEELVRRAQDVIKFLDMRVALR